MILSARLAAPKDKGDQKEITMSYDPKCDKVAESLYRIHNKVNHSRYKRTNIIQDRKKALSDRHSVLSTRSEQMS